MVSIRDAVLSAVCVLSLAMVAPAQGATLTVTEAVLPPGEEVGILCNKPEWAGSLIPIEIEDEEAERSDLVLIQLNSNGEGGNTWTVPPESEAWSIVTFRMPDGTEVTRVVGVPN